MTDAYHMFDLTSASGGAISLSRYVELDLEFLRLQVPMVRFLITQNPNKVLDPKHKTRLPGVVGWNLVKLVYQEFLKKYNIDVFQDFECPDVVNPLLFSELCIYYYADVMKCKMRMDWFTLKRSLEQKVKIIDKKTPKFC